MNYEPLNNNIKNVNRFLRRILTLNLMTPCKKK